MTTVLSKDSYTGTILQGQRLTVDAANGTALVERLSGGTVVETTAVTTGSAVFGEYLCDFQFRVTGLTGSVAAVVDQSTSKIDEVDVGFTNPMTTAGDIIYGGASGVATRRAKGTDGQVLQLASGVPVWADVTTIGRHAIPIMAGAMKPSVTGGCAALADVATTANQPDLHTLDFDATTQEYAQFALPMPKSWDEGTLTFAPIWSHAATDTNFGVVWDLQAVAASNDDGIAAAYGTAVTSSDTGGTTNDLYVGPESAALTVAGTPAAEDVVFFRLSRVTGNGSDTMAVDARLHGIVIYMTTNAGTDV